MTFKSFYHIMAYEVTKLVNGRPYRYRVRSERDPDTGKVRNRWTYLGRGDAAGAARAPPSRGRMPAKRCSMRSSACSTARDPGDVTADAVSIEAGLAHGTFYRYFRNRVDAIHALTDPLARRARRRARPARRAAGRRRRARASRCARGRPCCCTRACSTTVSCARSTRSRRRMTEIRNRLRERRDGNAQRLAGWLAALARARHRRAARRRVAPATVLFSMLDGIGREAVAAGEPLEEHRLAAAIDLVERAVFGTLT